MLIAKMSIKRPILTTVIILVFLIFGAIAYFTLNVDLQPEIEIPFVTISTIYTGAGPKEIETLVTKRIEDAVATVSEIKQIDSYSLDGVSIVILEFKLGKNVNVANQEVKDKVDEILNDLPEDAKKPIVQKVDLKAYPVIEVVLSGNLNGRQLWDIADKQLKDRFSQVEGVAKVNITGGQEREIRVILDNKTVFENSVSLPQLINILKAQNMNIPGGYFKINDQEYTVRLDGELRDVQTMLDMQIPTAFGLKKVREIAQVVDTGKDVRQKAVFYNTKMNFRNENVVRLGIVKASEGNVVKVAESIKKSLPEIQASLPAGCKLEIVTDESVFVKSSVDDTLSNVYLGVLFTAIVLLFFLHDFRSTFIVAITMPTAIVSTFMLIKAWGLTLNMMSLMGLSVTVGVLVANSIVVLENIFRYRDMGFSNKQAAYKGTAEVVVAVMASTMTNLVVFIPLANMSSIVGQFLKAMALAATFATLFSLFLSFTLTPMLAGLILPKTQKKGRLTKWFEAFDRSNERIYEFFLKIVLKNRIVALFSIIAVTGLLIWVIQFYGSKLGMEFMPGLDDGKIRITMELPSGSNLDQTAKLVKQVEEELKQYPQVIRILTDLGKLNDVDLGTNMASMLVQLNDANERDTSMNAFISMFTKDLSDLPNVNLKVDVGSQMAGPGYPIEFYLLGQDVDKLDELKGQIINKIRDVPGLINFDNSSRAGKPEITVIPKREKLSEIGVTVAELALSLRSSIEGMQSSKFRQEGDEYDITITLNDESVNAPEKINNITIATPVGSFRLSELADVKFTKGYTKILHRAKYTTIQFTGSNVADVPLGNVTSEIEKRLNEMTFPDGYKIKWGGNTEMMNEMFMDMGFAFLLAIVLTYMLMAALLESFVQPLYIMYTIPLALIGVILAQYIADVAFGLTSLMGIIMLIGIVVNNAILILDFTNQLRREEGYLPKEALMKACPTKLKPQIMSTTALILGMLPMAVGMGDAGKEIRIPLGVVSVGGLFVATILTLFIIPALYYVFSRNKIIIVNEEDIVE